MWFSPYEYIKLNLNYVQNKDGVVHKYAYLKKAIENDFANVQNLLYLDTIN